MSKRFPTPSQIAECGGPCYTQGREACDCGLKDYEPPCKQSMTPLEPATMYNTTSSQRTIQQQIIEAFLPEASEQNCTYFELRMRPGYPTEIAASFLVLGPAKLTEITRNWQLTEITDDQN